MTEMEKPVPSDPSRVTDPVLFDPDKVQVYSFLVMHPEKRELVCRYGGETVEEIRAKGYVTAGVVMEYDAAQALIDAHDKARFSGVYRIDAARYNEMLEVLPPVGWVGNCFSMMERTTGAWTACFTRAPSGEYLEGMRDCASETPSQAHDRMCRALADGTALPAPSGESEA